MKRPRCGVPDQFGVRVKANLRRRKRYTLTGKTWNSYHLTFRYGSSFKRELPYPSQRDFLSQKLTRRGPASGAEGPFLAPAGCGLDWSTVVRGALESEWPVGVGVLLSLRILSESMVHPARSPFAVYGSLCVQTLGQWFSTCG